MTTLSDDERMLLKALAAAKEPIGLHEVMQRIMPPRPDGPGQWGQQWWGRQWCANLRNYMDLHKAGMLERAGRGYVLTDAGREALAGTKEQA